MDPNNNSILITGAGAGLGANIANQMELRGFHVIRFDRKNGHDVRSPEIHKLYPAKLFALINCAGINKISWLENLTDDLWHETLDINLGGIMKMTRHLLPALEAGRGTVLNIVSNASHMPMRGSAAYNASKGAAHILTLQMARELYDRHGITVFGISPNKLAGTEMSADIEAQVIQSRGWTREEAQKYQLASLATHEETDPHTLAEFIGFLLSTKERHKFLHGCIIPYGA